MKWHRMVHQVLGEGVCGRRDISEPDDDDSRIKFQMYGHNFW